MENESNITGVIKKLSKTNDEIYAKVCKVLEVNKEEATIDVLPLDGGAEIFDVLLQAESENGGFIVFPKVGSKVVVVFLDMDNAVVANTSELDKLSLEIAPCLLEIDKDGFLLKKENETLKKLMGDLLKAIKAMKFTTNNGPTINLINIADFQAIENRFNQFLK